MKPENILLGEDGYIAISDFGISKILKEKEKTTSFCGTPGFIAPEILAGIPYNKTVDWWSFGAVLFELGFGGIPFEESSNAGFSIDDYRKKILDILKNHKIKFNEAIQRTDLFKDIIMKVKLKSFWKLIQKND